MVKRRAPIGQVLSRTAAAAIGGYALAYTFTAAAALLPLHPADAVFYPSLLSIVLYVAVAIWAFAARSGARVWALIVAACLACMLARLGLQA
ncbi:iron transporter [Bordetella sp. BOR01]|uniref:iron transporter n=1 Tax=Bordetella sp. BOR01 TaxID=2854779 RepID=UPI001C4569D9|nr:iron transporter [Bordetella sp. BOR01]MBV7482735.1 iron transporter [Bordetella sp. BOR01]